MCLAHGHRGLTSIALTLAIPLALLTIPAAAFDFNEVDSLMGWSDVGSGPRPGFVSLWDDYVSADLDGDDDPDLVLREIAGDTLLWFENTDGEGNFAARGVAFACGSLHHIAAADLDGDGDDDLILAHSTLVWVESDIGGSTPFTIHEIDDSSVHQWIEPLNFDGDADVDLFVAGTAGIVLFENGGGLSPVFTERSVTAHSANGCFPVDLDEDSDVDVVAASDDGVRWFESDGLAPPTYTERLVYTGVATSVAAMDVDGDSDLDILSDVASRVTWHENQGGDPPVWKIRTLSETDTDVVAAVDVDRDGELEPVAGQSELRWYERVDGTGLTWTESTIGDCDRRIISPADIDGDGFLDFPCHDFEFLFGGGLFYQWWTVHEYFQWRRNGSGLTPTVQLLDESGDGTLSPGEPGTLAITLSNGAVIDQTGVSLNVTPSSNLITLSSSSASWASLTAEDQVDLAIDFTTASEPSRGAQVSFTFQCAWDHGDVVRSGVAPVNFGLERNIYMTESESPGIEIPDNDPMGLSRILTFETQGGTIGRVSGTCEVTHPYVGDLLVTLSCEGGAPVTVFDDPGVAGENLDLDFIFWDEFDGEEASGDFILTIVDRAAGDVGTLDSWSVEIAYEGWLFTAWQPDHILDQITGLAGVLGPYDPDFFDLNGDGEIDVADLVHLLNHMMQ